MLRSSASVRSTRNRRRPARRCCWRAGAIAAPVPAAHRAGHRHGSQARSRSASGDLQAPIPPGCCALREPASQAPALRRQAPDCSQAVRRHRKSAFARAARVAAKLRHHRPIPLSRRPLPPPKWFAMASHAPRSPPERCRPTCVPGSSGAGTASALPFRTRLGRARALHAFSPW